MRGDVKMKPFSVHILLPMLSWNPCQELAERRAGIIGRRMIHFLPPIFLPTPAVESDMKMEADDGVLRRLVTEMIR